MVEFNSYASGFLLGAGASIPIGPINILIINEALVSYRSAFLIGLGAMSADLTYLLLIFFGVFSHLNEHSLFFKVLSLLGGAFLIYLAYKIYKSRMMDNSKLKTDLGYVSPAKSYVKGYGLTLLNPYTIAFWSSILAYIGQNELNIVLVVFGLISAISLWISLMPFFVHKTKSFFSAKLNTIINLVSALIIFGFGMSIFARLLLTF